MNKHTHIQAILRITSALLTSAFALGLTACGTASGGDDGKLTVTATNFALYDFARAVCGDSCNVRMLLAPGSESHDFEATLEDIALLAETDVFVYVGGESEAWVPDVLEAAGVPDAVQIRAIDLVETHISAGTDSAHDHDHSADDGHHHEIDEHIWTSIPNAGVIMREILDTVSEADKENSEDYLVNYGVYLAELMEIDAEIREIVDNAALNTVIFADRFPFRYFTEEYGLSYCAAFDGCSSAVEPTLSTVNGLIERVNEIHGNTVFTIEFSDRKTAEAVAAETGCEILEFHSAHNVSRAEFDAGVTYADIMRRNAENLAAALN